MVSLGVRGDAPDHRALLAEPSRHRAPPLQEVMLEVFDAPDRDRYQIITVHPAGQIVAEDTNLGFERTNDLDSSCRLPAGQEPGANRR